MSRILFAFLCVFSLLFGAEFDVNLSPLVLYFKSKNAPLNLPKNPFRVESNGQKEVQNICPKLNGILNQKAIFGDKFFVVGDEICRSKIIKIGADFVSLENGEKINMAFEEGENFSPRNTKDIFKDLEIERQKLFR